MDGRGKSFQNSGFTGPLEWSKAKERDIEEKKRRGGGERNGRAFLRGMEGGGCFP